MNCFMELFNRGFHGQKSHRSRVPQHHRHFVPTHLLRELFDRNHQPELTEYGRTQLRD